MKPPKFVKFNNGSALRLIDDEYYRDAGDWSTKYIFEDGVLLSWFDDLPHLHLQPLTEITEQEWRDDNGEYAPKYP